MSELFENLMKFMKGDVNAVQLASDLLFLAHLADDLVDGDKQRSKEEIKLAFRKTFVDMPRNPFYVAYFPQISTLLSSSYLLWLDSMELESGTKDERFICFHIRTALLNCIHYFMLLVGGEEWVQEQGPDFWRVMGLPFSNWEELEVEEF